LLRYIGGDLVYKNFPVFTPFVANGSNGTLTGTIAMPKGNYRITMCGGGGSPGLIWAGSKFVRKVSCGSGGGIYGCMQVTKNQYISYSVGAINAATTFGSLTCNAGGVAVQLDSDNGKGGTGGTISGTEYLYDYIIAKNGNDGGFYANQNYTDYGGGASVLVLENATSLYPAINLSYGRGASATGETSAMAGYLKVEKIS
jgi:hypothetical protein